MVGENDAEQSIAYELQGTDNNQTDTPVYRFLSSQMGQERKVKLLVTQSDWNSAPPGTYSDVLVFQTRVVKAR